MDGNPGRRRRIPSLWLMQVLVLLMLGAHGPGSSIIHWDVNFLHPSSEASAQLSTALAPAGGADRVEPVDDAIWLVSIGAALVLRLVYRRNVSRVKRKHRSKPIVESLREGVHA